MLRLAAIPAAAVWMLAVLLAAAEARGQSAWYEGFEGPEPSWREAGSDARYRIQEHRRLQGQSHTGLGCEWLSIAADPGGSAIYLAHDAGRPRVIDDLLPTVWVKADRAGVQFGVEVVLPRTTDPRTGRPVSTRLLGPTYTNAGHWQQLRFDDLGPSLARRIRVLRSQLGPQVDGREAFVNAVLLNVWAGPGVTNIWIDDLDIAGYVAAAPVSDVPPRPAVQPISTRPGITPPVVEPPRSAVQLAGSVLLLNGRPMFPRAIQYQGEPLTLLRQLGFNAVWLTQPPSLELLQEAGRLGLWLICPPPRPGQLDPAYESSAPALQIGPEFQPVLAWDLGGPLAAEQLEATGRWAEQVRMADGRGRRPLVCAPRSALRGYSRHVDFLLIDRRPIGTSLELADYGVWVRRQPLLARPGTPVWTTVQTQPSEALRRQLAALDPGRPPPATVAQEQLQLLALTAIASGSRGLLFVSQSPLSADDPETRQRAMSLELLNLELDVIEPWAAAGSFMTTAATSVPEVTGAVLRTDRARLVLPAWYAPGAQCVAPQAAANNLGVIVPGVPESASAYELTGGRLQPLRHKRVTGGVRITLDEFGLSGLVVLAQDPLLIDAVTRRAAAIAKRSAELERHLAVRKLNVDGQVAQQMGRRTAPAAQAAERLAAARRDLQWCDGQLAANQYQAASLYARRAMQPLRAFERASWEAALAGMPSPVASPGTTGFTTLPWHAALLDRMAASRPGPNRLPGGDFEDLRGLLQSGWRHFQHPVEGVGTAADLVAEAAHSGTLGLRLTARSDDPGHPPAVMDSPPLWITSPAVPVEAGQIVVIHGWVNIPARIDGSVDGLLIVDSLAGEDLAERIDKTAGWREFTIYRAAAQSGPMTVTFALSGLGEARLDDVTIQVLQSAVPHNATSGVPGR